MNKAKIFMNGRSQAIRIPKEYRFDGNEVYIKKFGDIVILLPKDNPWNSLISSVDNFSSDFMEDRNQGKNRIRESF